MKPKYIAVAVDEKNGIGKHNALAWHFEKEMQYFQDLTTKTEDPSKKNIVMMGKNTWLSLPEKARPLSGRKNVVLSFDEMDLPEGVLLFKSMDEAFAAADKMDDVEKLFICGGAQVYKFSLPYMDGLYVTHIKKTYDCDVFFPEIPDAFTKKEKLGEDEEKGVKFEYWLYRK